MTQRHTATPAKKIIANRLNEVRTMRSQLHAVQAESKQQLSQTTDPDVAAALQSILQSRAIQLSLLDEEAKRLRLTLKGWDKRNQNYPESVSVPKSNVDGEESLLEVASQRVSSLNSKLNQVRSEMKSKSQIQHSLKKEMTKPHSKERTPTVQAEIIKNRTLLTSSIKHIRLLKEEYNKAHEAWFQLSKQ